MYCARCGAQNDDNAYACVSCGNALHPQAVAPPFRPPMPSIPNYLVWAILCTLFCCMPFGIVAIIYAADVDGKLAMGDLAGAQTASDAARKWCWVSFWVDVGAIVLAVLGFVIFAVVIGVSSHHW